MRRPKAWESSTDRIQTAQCGSSMPHNEGSSHSLTLVVNLLARFFRPYFSVDKKSSQEQLRQDFGEFPPTPLRCESLTGEFNVVRASGIGQIYHELAVQFRVMDADIESLSTDFLAKFNAKQLHEWHSTFESMGPRGSRFAKLAMFGWLLVMRTAKAVRYGTKRPNVRGMFVPYFKDGLQIFVKSQKHLNESDAYIVSHEHIHLLQHVNPESHCRHVRSPQELLTEEGLTDKFILYVLEKEEVEARLHEAVLSFYRAYHYLPTTVTGFLGLLASSEKIGLLVIGILESGDVTFDREQRKYPERNARPVEQLGWVLADIKTPALQCRYITEVLPVMYGNMFRYYGDNVASGSFHKGIDRPNFYDELYGTQVA